MNTPSYILVGQFPYKSKRKKDLGKKIVQGLDTTPKLADMVGNQSSNI